MMPWIFIAILSYLFFSLSFLGDKLILNGPPKPKLYTFYVGLLSILVIFFIPFTKFSLPDASGIVWIILEAIVYIVGLYTMFLALEKFDVSMVMLSIGAFQPIYILFLTWLIWGFQSMTLLGFMAFLMLFLGSIIISIRQTSGITANYLVLTSFSSFMFSLDYIFSKLVFFHEPFLQGLIWMRVASFLLILLFLFDKDLRNQLFEKKISLNKKTGLLFLFTQGAGSVANILQSLAIALVPVTYLAVVNSLRGLQYIFLFIITLFLSFVFPKILQEDTSRKIIIQRAISMTLIVAGLAMLIF